MAAKASAASRTVAASTPVLIIVDIVPRNGTRPKVAARPTVPDKAAGIRMLPPPSKPTAIGVRPRATATPLPEELPPGRDAALRHDCQPDDDGALGTQACYDLVVLCLHACTALRGRHLAVEHRQPLDGDHVFDGHRYSVEHSERAASGPPGSRGCGTLARERRQHRGEGARGLDSGQHQLHHLARGRRACTERGVQVFARGVDRGCRRLPPPCNHNRRVTPAAAIAQAILGAGSARRRKAVAQCH
eukprot:scaffold26075_cov69-Phaeocystis_antarctica.AAC.2